MFLGCFLCFWVALCGRRFLVPWSSADTSEGWGAVCGTCALGGDSAGGSGLEASQGSVVSRQQRETRLGHERQNETRKRERLASNISGIVASQGAQAAELVWEEVASLVAAELRRHKGYGLLLCGHSLGGGTAAILAALLMLGPASLLSGPAPHLAAS